ncbi:hypothetical protein E1I18_00860 [Mycoplasmopsis mucosicanis]|uniref:Uncharacterized protein n=1 Tax=Mycoplasmopsis mucosicanis TaxID=458208 RepID=A0A507SUV4_9BACT|nr:NusA N-terminal domain-containing protein [Mycoplasmopsis mucosicanis]TQC53995.1 hypothetical protein E1I18_00860 [Mycoplasmopsis mucosicanis]
MSKNTIANQDAVFYNIAKHYETNQKIDINDIVRIFSGATTRILSKIDQDIEVEYILNEETKTLKPIIKTCIVIDDQEADEYANGDDNDKLLLILTYISLTNARKIKSDAQIDDVISIDLDLKALDKAVENTKDPNILKKIHSSILQEISALKKQKVYECFKDKIGQRVGIRYSTKNADGSWNVQIESESLLSTSAFLPAAYISSKRNVKPGAYGHATITSVEEDSKLSQVQVSVDTKENVEELLKLSIPEIQDGLIEIVASIRQPGERTKIALKPSDLAPADYDVYGAVVGPNGNRINSICEKIGEKIDVILYDEDVKKYISQAMSPAKVIDVVPKDNNVEGSRQNYWIIVPQDSLTPAIGRKGINVLLAAGLVGCNLEVISNTDALSKGIVFNNSKKFEPNKKPNQQFNTNRHTQRPKRNGSLFDMNKVNVKADNFDADVLSFQENEFEGIDTTSFDLDFNELFKKHSESEAKKEKQEQSKEITIDDIAEELTRENAKKEQYKNDAEDYKRVKESIKENFKVDKDLSSFGLDDFDIDDFMDDEDWGE